MRALVRFLRTEDHLLYPFYGIRPQFFIPLITLLVQTSKNSIECQKQLAVAKNQSINVTNFENALLDFKDKFGYNYRLASETAEDLTIKKLTRGNPTMKQKFDESRESAEVENQTGVE